MERELAAEAPIKKLEFGDIDDFFTSIYDEIPNHTQKYIPF
jgi:hypothetical protein